MKETKIYPFGIKACLCYSVLSKMKGMMFSSKRKKPLLFIFSKEKRIPIHMLFVFFRLLVVWIDSKKRVVDFKIMHPFTMYSPISRARYVLEIPFIDDKNSRSIAGGLKKGAQLRFRY